MGRKNKNARKVYRIDYARFAKSIKLNAKQRVKVLKYFKNLYERDLYREDGET